MNETYNVVVIRENTYRFNVELTQEELSGVCKVLNKCTRFSNFNDIFMITKDGSGEVIELLERGE